MTIRLALLLTLVSVVGATPAQAAYDCETSVDEYNTALNDISTAIRRYVNCIESSGGKIECSSEFRRLRYANDALESAQLNISSNCRD